MRLLGRSANQENRFPVPVQRYGKDVAVADPWRRAVHQPFPVRRHGDFVKRIVWLEQEFRRPTAVRRLPPDSLPITARGPEDYALRVGRPFGHGIIGSVGSEESERAVGQVVQPDVRAGDGRYLDRNLSTVWRKPWTSEAALLADDFNLRPARRNTHKVSRRRSGHVPEGSVFGERDEGSASR